MRHWRAVLVSIALAGAAVAPFSQRAHGDPVKLTLSDEASLKVDAFWEPITESVYKVFQQEQFRHLFDFKPAIPTREYRSADLAAFLPDDTVVEVGDIWKLSPEKLLVFLNQFSERATISA